MPFEVSVSDVHSFPGIGWDTRPRYSSRTLVGHWDEERTGANIIGGQRGSSTRAASWTSMSQLSYSQPIMSPALVRSASSMRSDNLSQSLTHRQRHESVHNTITLNRSAPPSVHKRDPQAFDASIRRGKIPSMTGKRSYNRSTGRWEPEPIDAATPPPRSTRLRDSLRKKWQQDAAAERASPYTTTARESFKKLPPIQPTNSSFKRSATFSSSNVPHVLSRNFRSPK